MSLQFEILARAGAARRGVITLPHGTVETPVFMPVGTLANVKGVPQDVLEDLGVQILLSNTYHLYLRPGVEMLRRLGGLHRFMSWERNILTDSGGFQVFSLNDLRKVSEEGVQFRSHLDGSSQFLGPESATQAQIGLGADVIMAFDECTEYPADRRRTRDSMEMTLRWARRCKEYFEEHKQEVPWGLAVQADATAMRPQKQIPRAARDDNSNADGRRPTTDDRQSLFGIIQGGTHADLRLESAERTVEIGFPGYAIGGLSVGEPREASYEVVAATVPLIPEDKPRYLMGVGTPEEIVRYAALGIDMMDCVLPTRAARHGLLFTSEGKITIKNARFAADEGPLDPRCGCSVCRRYSRAYLRHLYASNEMLAQVLNTVHNLAYYLDTMRAVRHSIGLGGFTGLLSDLPSPHPERPKADERESRA
jgi:queuine tRNA-ribosyltransferase